MSLHTRTLRVRVKDKHASVLSGMAYEVNQVWNAANEITRDYSWVPVPGVGYVNLQTSEFDLNKELRGIREERNLCIGAATVQSVIAQHARSRRQFKKNQLQWRASSGSKRALGWIPFKAAGVKRVMEHIAPYSMGALLVTLVLLFALQGNAIMKQPLVIAILAVPILIQVLFNSSLAYWLNHRLGVAHCVGAPSALIGASNFFELAVATAISLYGFQSGAALATVVGVLIEVPIMLLVVNVANRTKDWYSQPPTT